MSPFVPTEFLTSLCIGYFLVPFSRPDYYPRTYNQQQQHRLQPSRPVPTAWAGIPEQSLRKVAVFAGVLGVIQGYIGGYIRFIGVIWGLFNGLYWGYIGP